MTTRSRGLSQSNEWDMHDDYNTSLYDPQYPDDDINGGVQLDHCRLYITNITKGLSEEGLRAAFSKYGTLVEIHMNKDPLKKYGLVKYETPGEAKLAMMKMNRTEPLRLNVAIAHKPKSSTRKKQDRKSRTGPNNRDHAIIRDERGSLRDERGCMRDERGSFRDERGSNRDDSASLSSRGKYSRKQEEVTNGDDFDDMPEDDDFGYTEMDANLHLELETLKLEQLKLCEEQLMCKRRMLLLRQADKKPVQNQVSNRCILPDGKIVVRNVSEKAADADVSFGAGGGDSSASSRACVSCGRPADAYCSGCGLTPYCGPRCQRRDWSERHRAVCHNLARVTAGKEPQDSIDAPVVVEPVFPPMAPLRAPHTQSSREPKRGDDTAVKAAPAQARREPSRGDDSTSDKSAKKPFSRAPNGRSPRPAADGANNARRSAVDRFRQPAGQDSTDEAWGRKTETATPPPAQEAKVAAFKSVEQSRPAIPEPAVPKQEPVVPKSVPVVPKSIPVVPKPEVSGRHPPASVNDVTPGRILVPKTCLIEQLSTGDSLLLSVDGKGSECRSQRPGFVCLSMHEQFEGDYNKLCEDYVQACERDSQQYKPIPGESCSYFNPEDGGWYRARCLNPTTLALLDSGKVISLQPTDKLRALPADYQNIPEFCCLVQANGLEVGLNLKCTIISKTTEGHKVAMENVDSGASMGEGEVTRWIPTVEYVTTKPAVPEVSRPSVSQGSTVLLVEATSPARAFVRPAERAAQAAYDDVLQRVALCGQQAEPLKEPPAKGQTVLGKFADGLHYRALCKRTNVKQNKYLLEYIEFGNGEVSSLENIYPCPKELDLSSIPSQISQVSLSTTTTEFTPAALEYVEKLKDDAEELVLSIPGGAGSASSGVLVELVVAKNKEHVNRKLDAMCKPEWKAIQERDGDVIEVERLMYDDLEYLDLPAGGCVLDVLDVSVLDSGVLSGCERGTQHANFVLNQLAEKMAEYCNSELGKDPYLPRPEELCIAQFPPYPQWYRAVLLEQVGGPGGLEARVCYVDFGNMATVSVTLLRKMLPEFVRGVPMLASMLEIRGFPKNVTPAMLHRAAAHMNINEEGRGELAVARAERLEPGVYVVDAPRLLAAMATE